MSEMLKKARAYEAEKAAQTDKNTRPLFHISAPAGWINDPNGFSIYDGKIHLFYQYYPYAREWGPMHWGHSVTTDMISWEQLPAALAPDQDYDRIGCFSGSAIEADNKHVLVYTGVTKITLPDGREEERQNQCIAFGDGRDYVKYENNPVVTGEMLPENCSRIDFRDPKIWKEEDTYYLIVGSKDNRQIGQVVLCSSKDLKEWKFETVLAANSTGKVGTMWECPDFFSLGDQHYLMFSPQGMNAEGYSYRNRFQSGVIPGMWSPGRLFAQSGHFTELDNGHDFYAPQSFLAKDGRRIVIGWMDMWESPMPSKREGWAGCMTLARELSESNGKLLQRPVHEAESLRQQHQSISPRTISNKYVLQENAQAVEIQLQWALKNSDAEHYGLQLGTGMRLYIDNQSERLVLWRYYPHENLDGYRSIPLPQGDMLALRIFIDTSSVEVFINDGEAVMSSRIYPQPEERELSLYASHGVAVLQHGALWQLG